jgi:hypothetical protein
MKIESLLDGKEYKVIDNFLSSDLADKVLEQLSARNFPYYFSEKTLDESIKKSYFDKGIRTTVDNRILDYCMFNHYFYDTSQSQDRMSGFDITDKMLDYMVKNYNLENIILYKVKANLTTQMINATKDNFAEPHIDVRDNDHIGLIYYVNDSDGDTFMFDNKLNIKTRITPKKNRVVVFKGDILHSAGHPLKNNKRLVINFDFKI